MREHELKVDTAYFDALASGEKNFESRRDDRGFQKGDVLVLRRFGRDSITGSIGYLQRRFTVIPGAADTVRRRISYILTGGQLGIETGFVVMALAPEESGDA